MFGALDEIKTAIMGNALMILGAITIALLVWLTVSIFWIRALKAEAAVAASNFGVCQEANKEFAQATKTQNDAVEKWKKSSSDWQAKADAAAKPERATAERKFAESNAALHQPAPVGKDRCTAAAEIIDFFSRERRPASRDGARP